MVAQSEPPVLSVSPNHNTLNTYFEPIQRDFFVTSRARTHRHLFVVNVKSIIREKEKVYTENFKNKKFTDDEWVQILCEHPILIDGFKAIVARPPELVEELINRKNRK